MLKRRKPRQGDLWRVNVSTIKHPKWWMGVVLSLDETHSDRHYRGTPCKILYMSPAEDEEHPPTFGEWIIDEDSPYFELLGELDP